MILGGGVSVYELDSDGPVVRRLGCPEIHVLNSLARTDIWPLGKVNSLVQIIGSLACNVVEHGRLAGSKQRVACLKIALGSVHVKEVKRPVLCIVVGNLDVQVKAVLLLGITAIERTVSHRLIGNACYLDRLRIIGLGLLGLLLHRCAPARATRRITAAASSVHANTAESATVGIPNSSFFVMGFIILTAPFGLQLIRRPRHSLSPWHRLPL